MLCVTFMFYVHNMYMYVCTCIHMYVHMAQLCMVYVCDDICILKCDYLTGFWIFAQDLKKVK